MVGSTGPTPPRLPTTMSDNDLFRERSGTLWNFVELYVWGKSSGTLWNFIMGLMERNNYGYNDLIAFSFEYDYYYYYYY